MIKTIKDSISQKISQYDMSVILDALAAEVEETLSRMLKINTSTMKQRFAPNAISLSVFDCLLVNF